MPIPKMVEREEEELIANGTIHQAERELSRKIGWNERHDIAEKRNEAIVEELELMKISRHFVDKACCGDFSLAFDLAQRKIYNLIQELQPPEQSPKGKISEKDKAIILTKEEFDNLPEYSCSLPTGTTIGKKWKSKVNYNDSSKGWLLAEYIEIGKKDKVGIKWLDIILEQSPKGEENK